MTTRVSDCDVKEIISTSLDNLRAYVISANALINQHLLSKGLDESLLKEIERWLSAHFVAVNDQRLKSEKLGDATDQYSGETGMGLDFTQFGQQVKLLDPTGTLAALGQRRAFFKVL